MADPSTTACTSSLFPVIDIRELLLRDGDAKALRECGEQLVKACENTGFFYVRTGVRPGLIESLSDAAHKFFALSTEEKETIKMAKSGKSWRGFFKVGDELTSGKADQKEGIYFGREEDYSGEMPLRGPNLWPQVEGRVLLKDDVLEYMDFMRLVGLRLMGAISKALGAGAACLDAHFAENPTELFRIFSYPSPREEEGDAEVFGVGEHTDYGFLTLLYQDQTGGLQVKIPSEDRSGFQWIEVPFIPGTHVVNLGDALEHYTHGRFKATPHRVIYHGRRATGKPRLSFPYFFDPCWGAPMTPMTPMPLDEEGRSRTSGRWDGADPTQFEGIYGDYLQRKISRVFPQLFAQAIRTTS